ncbi:histidine--tRNA ligase [Candidatus Gottesmanbacteria bacterium]|nr:histidine--tRNA ligase [Candidatus Gottesmanbacteria bacterium]
MITPQTLKGFRDFLPQQQIKRRFLINLIAQVFELYGFDPLETPALEYAETLLGKYGKEADKLMYTFQDRGGREVGLRYDQTVPLARVTAQYDALLPKPFKRYQMQPVWRADKPQKGRFREFLQCDADIVGSESLFADAELIALAASIIKKIGFPDFTILLNDRNIFNDLLTREVISPDTLKKVLTSLDKLKKIGKEKVLDELISKGLTTQHATYFIQTIDSLPPTPRLQQIMDVLPDFGVDKESYSYTSTLVRGLDYYTSTIFEIEIAGYTSGSVCGGGRYDNLIKQLGGNQTPAAGFAIGFDRLLEAADNHGLITVSPTSTKILFTVFSKSIQTEIIKLAASIRELGINSEIVYETDTKLDKQIKYADRKGIEFVAIIGPDEVEKKSVTLKNLKTKQQITVLQKDLPDVLKKA